MSVILKPCPFCGKDPVMIELREVIDDFARGYEICCDECGIQMNDEYRDEVAKSWNRRTRPSRKAPPEPTT